MELKTKTGNLVENLEKCLNDDIHELQDCRISKHTVNHSVYIIKNKILPYIFRGSSERFI